MKQNRITLKNIKHAEFASEETNCYKASVYFDGKRVGIVSNDGHGGCDYQWPRDQAGWDAMHEYISELNKREDQVEKAKDIRAAMRQAIQWGEASLSENDLQEPDEVILRDFAWVIEQKIFEIDLESICSDLLERHLQLKVFKKACRKKIAFFTGIWNGEYSFFGTGRHTEESIRAHIMKKYPKATIINDLTEDQWLDMVGSAA
jgi:hypothetical protein